VWDRADHFDVTRPVDTQHLAFGWGPHICLGASLGRLETAIVFEEILDRFSSWELAGTPERRATGLGGLERLALQFHR